MSVKIKLLYNNDIFIEALAKSVTWSGEDGLPHRTLMVTLSNTFNADDQAVYFELGKELRFYAEENGAYVGLFRGTIFSYDIDSSGNGMITAYDENVYLTKNADTRKFTAMTAAAIIRDICKSYDIPIGTIADTGYVIPRVIFREADVWAMVSACLTETRKQNGRKFRLWTSNGALHLTEKKDTVVRWMLEDGVNILSANRSRSIEDTRTSVKIIGGDEEKNPITALARDSGLAAKYGTMQYVERADMSLNKSQIDQLAKQRLKELGKVAEEVSVEALGISEVIAGVSVYAFESMTEIVGGYYVTADSHTFEDGVHRMEVTLSRTDDLPKLGYEDAFDEVKAAKKKKKIKEESVVDQLVRQINAANGG
ncbi:XkdQ/YqbQ family protein [Cohnella mopanensis]|uniref:XkdQ/YqbQ family protein n=1 Tax=Cohnella mopanensis TaxID=2911966 RepID=UPI001EF8FEE2|nr:hypothetical protein [Cohnella mopanensis]